MKLAAPFALALLLVSCRSSLDVIDERTLDCEPGQDISIMAGLDNSAVRESPIEGNLELVVEVSNNSHDEVTVTFIRGEQLRGEDATFRVENAYRKFDQVIEEGEDYTFHLPTSGRALLGDRNRGVTSSSSGLEMIVTVGLSNGDSYRCQFAMSTR